MTTTGARRPTYHHGDLRAALLAAGTELARQGGPDAVVLREATRRAGVAPGAAYRHFADRDALLHAVSQTAQADVARAMEVELAAIADDDAHGRLRAVGLGYLRFAHREPGLFRVAFEVSADLADAANPVRAGDSGRSPFQLLSHALDGLVEARALAPDRRPGAEFLAWAAVHGLAVLLLDGPLRSLDDATRERAYADLLAMVEKGL